MPLKLELQEKKCEEIEFGKVKLKVPGAIPFELMVEFYDLKNMDPKKITSQDLKDMARLTKEILYTQNDSEKVNRFVSGLDVDNLAKVIVFITNYLACEEDSKKKDSKADSGN